MSISDADIAFTLELFEAVPNLSKRKMMGGAVFYSDGQVFALTSSSGQIYLKASGAFAEELAAEGAEIFTMTNKDGSTGSMGYWTLPDAALDAPEEATRWALRGLSFLQEGG